MLRHTKREGLQTMMFQFEKTTQDFLNVIQGPLEAQLQSELETIVRSSVERQKEAVIRKVMEDCKDTIRVCLKRGPGLDGITIQFEIVDKRT